MEIKIVFDKESHNEYNKLKAAVQEGRGTLQKPTNKQLLKSIEKALTDIKRNHKCGDLIPRKQLTKKAIQK